MYRFTEKGREAHRRANRKYKAKLKEMHPYKRCRRCGMSKHLTEFGRSIHIHNLCKECKPIRAAELTATVNSRAMRYHWDNHDYVLDRMRGRRMANIGAAIMCAARSRAKRKGLDFEITAEDVVVPDVCPILGIPLFPSSGKVGPNSPSIDRIDNRLGYVKDNVIVISFKANTIKNSATVGELRLVADFYERLTRAEVATV